MINGASSLNGASSFNGYLVRLLLEPVHGMLRLNLTDEDKLRDDGSAVETMAVETMAVETMAVGRWQAW